MPRSGRRGFWARARRASLLLALSLGLSLAGAAPAQAVSFTEVRDAAFDVVVLRPLNTAAVVLGSVFFVASVPFVAPFVGVRSAWDVYVYAPYEYAFERELGDF